jgi:hypothetical protein
MDSSVGPYVVTDGEVISVDRAAPAWASRQLDGDGYGTDWVIAVADEAEAAVQLAAQWDAIEGGDLRSHSPVRGVLTYDDALVALGEGGAGWDAVADRMAAIDYEAQCPEHGCARHRCNTEHT